MTLNEMYREAKSRGKTDICRFMRDMKRAGLRLRTYNGRCFWKGPGVVVRHVSDAMSETRVKCQFDSMGLDVIVYPRQSL